VARFPKLADRANTLRGSGTFAPDVIATSRGLLTSPGTQKWDTHTLLHHIRVHLIRILASPTPTQAHKAGALVPLPFLSPQSLPQHHPPTTMLPPLSSSSSSPAVHILVHWVFPLTGSLLGFLMSIAPLRAVRRAEKAGELGALNPLPSCVFLLNCTAWLLYGAAARDPFVFCAVCVFWCGEGGRKREGGRGGKTD